MVWQLGKLTSFVGKNYVFLYFFFTYTVTHFLLCECTLKFNIDEKKIALLWKKKTWAKINKRTFERKSQSFRQKNFVVPNDARSAIFNLKKSSRINLTNFIAWVLWKNILALEIIKLEVSWFALAVRKITEPLICFFIKSDFFDIWWRMLCQFRELYPVLQRSLLFRHSGMSTNQLNYSCGAKSFLLMKFTRMAPHIVSFLLDV